MMNYIKSPRPINFMPSIQKFIAQWSDKNHIGNHHTEKFLKSPFGNKNYSGEPGDISGPSFTKHQTDFSNSLEEGICDIVLLLVEKHQLITYTSCEGHYYNSDLPNSERHVGILPKTREQFEIITNCLNLVVTHINSSKKNSAICLSIVKDYLYDNLSRAPILDIYFVKAERSSWINYFELLPNFYRHVLTKLAQMPPFLTE